MGDINNSNTNNTNNNDNNNNNNSNPQDTPNEMKDKTKDPNNNTNETGEDNLYIFDEPDDELEEFEEMGSVSINTDTDLENWDEDWGATGWDDEDDDDDKFITKVEQELKKFKPQIDSFDLKKKDRQ